ncbi:MAG: hypothetical protein IH943_04910 [Acidobacteria bacterium]|nr:hypothetical protein [Acidobacteriota bacterium]
MSQFLIIYQKSTGSLVDFTEYGDDDRAVALKRRAQLEREYGASGDIEVVVLGARDKSDLERSHSRYFKTLSDLVST